MLAEGRPCQPESCDDYWIESRCGGQYVAITLPIRLVVRDRAPRRESHDERGCRPS